MRVFGSIEHMRRIGKLPCRPGKHRGRVPLMHEVEAILERREKLGIRARLPKRKTPKEMAARAKNSAFMKALWRLLKAGTCPHCGGSIRLK